MEKGRWSGTEREERNGGKREKEKAKAQATACRSPEGRSHEYQSFH